METEISETAVGDHHLADGKAVRGATVEWGFGLTAHVKSLVNKRHGRTLVGETGKDRARFGHRTTDGGDGYSTSTAIPSLFDGGEVGIQRPLEQADAVGSETVEEIPAGFVLLEMLDRNGKGTLELSADTFG